LCIKTVKNILLRKGLNLSPIIYINSLAVWIIRLGSVVGIVIQATGKSKFEDGLRFGGSGSDFEASPQKRVLKASPRGHIISLYHFFAGLLYCLVLATH
jgi:hypothetical protein